MRVPDADPPDSADMVIHREMRRQVGCDYVMMLIAAQIDLSETHFISKDAQITLFLWILGAVLMAAASPPRSYWAHQKHGRAASDVSVRRWPSRLGFWK